jgi:hypothetical protein
LEAVDAFFARNPGTGDYHVRVSQDSGDSDGSGSSAGSGDDGAHCEYKLPAAVCERLYDYQREAIHWSAHAPPPPCDDRLILH